MIRSLKYVNNLGRSVEFGAESVWHFGGNDLFNIKTEYSQVGNTITSFKNGIREFSLNAFLRGGSIADVNNFIDVISYDTYIAKPGVLYAGDSYMYCYISAADLSNYQYIDGHANLSLTVLSDNPVWVRKATTTLTQRTAKPTAGLSYPYNYPYNYLASNDENDSVTNPFQLPAKCDISFAGPCVSPYVIIGRNRYQVNAAADKGQLITIKGFGTKDIVLKSSDGSETSIFSAGVRKKDAHCFAEIPVGINNASWPGTPNIEIAIYEERRSPWQI